MGNARFELVGVGAMREKFRLLMAATSDAMVPAVRVEAEGVTTNAKKVTPVDLGPLHASGHVAEVKREGRVVTATIAFGGEAAPYALAVHEQAPGSPYNPPSWRGKAIEFSPSSAGNKYLEKPLLAAIPGMEARIASRLLRGFPSGRSRSPQRRDSRGRFISG